MVDEIQRLVEINKHYYSQLKLELSIGSATSLPGEKLESVAKRADILMYERKREHYTAGSTAKL